MRDPKFELKKLCRPNRDGRYASQRDREHVLDMVARQLQELGYRYHRYHCYHRYHRPLRPQLRPGRIPQAGVNYGFSQC